VSKAQLNPHLFDLPFHEAGPLTDLLAEIFCPVLLIHGDTERGSLISAEYAERCARAAAGEFRAVHIAGAGHSVRRDKRTRTLRNSPHTSTGTAERRRIRLLAGSCVRSAQSD
jgi:pimeloyl-ACP methyl ester carboxylesterase